MFVLKIVHSLNTREFHSLKDTISRHRRPTVGKLLDAILKYKNKDISPTKQELFEAAFDRVYIKKEDYLIRKELQYLRDAVREFLIDNEFQLERGLNDELKALFYTKALVRLKQHDEIEKILLNLEERTSSSIVPAYHTEQIFSLISYIVRQLQVNPAYLKKTDTYLKLLKSSISRQLLYQFSQYRTHEAFLQYRKLAVSDLGLLRQYIEEQSKITDGEIRQRFIEGLGI